MLLALEISEDCVSFSFDQVRGMTPAQALQEHRLNQLFAALTDHPRQGLGHAIEACGLGQTRGVVPLFEQTFGIDMPLFLLTCRRASDDRLFRRLHPDPEALVLAP
jgi:methylphosphotriester-DNA--protein-cysteine methyltransferase